MVEGINYDLLKGTEKIYWVFVPLYNNTPSQLEWFLEYSVDASYDIKSIDMSQLQYVIYNWDTPAWEALSKTGHLGFYGNATDKPYFGQMTPQKFYIKIDSSVTDYISSSGLVYVGLDFKFVTSAYESEIHNNSGIQQYIARNSILVTHYNSVIVR